MSIEFNFPSSDGQTTIYARKWMPTVAPVGIIQIIHGMAEHIQRYAEFAENLAAHGWIVVGDDHLGHGKTATISHLGYFGDDHPVEHLQQDEIKLMHLIKKANPSLPYVMLGHSMGAMILQAILRKISFEIDAAILIGTSATHPELLPAWPLISALNKTKPKQIGHFLDRLSFGGFSKSFNKHVKYSWLTHDPLVLKQYEDDPKSGFIFTNNGFYNLLSLTKIATSPHWVDNVRKGLPILIASGTNDSVGKFGKGPEYHFNLLTNAQFKNVTLKLFEDLRHEILNEVSRKEVYQFINVWLKNNLLK